MIATLRTITDAVSVTGRGEEEWERCRHWIADALEYAEGIYTLDEVRDAIRAGEMHFWPGEHCAAVTEIGAFPRRRFLNVILAGGDLKELIGMIPAWKAWGRFLGCSDLKVVGRRGWERVLGTRGWKRAFVVLTTPIETTANG